MVELGLLKVPVLEELLDVGRKAIVRGFIGCDEGVRVEGSGYDGGLSQIGEDFEGLVKSARI